MANYRNLVLVTMMVIAKNMIRGVLAAYLTIITILLITTMKIIITMIITPSQMEV